MSLPSINTNNLDFEKIILDKKSYVDVLVSYLRYKNPKSQILVCYFSWNIRYTKAGNGCKYLTSIPADLKDKADVLKQYEFFLTSHMINI